MSRRAFIGVLGVTTIVVAACSAAGPTSHTTTGKPLIYEPTTGVTFSDDFNPYDPNSVASSVGMKSIVYEPLVEFDQLDPTAAGTHYWLATAYAFQNGGKDLQITLRTGVKFSDGSSFGPKDVAATFAAMNVPKADIPGVAPQASPATISGNTVTLHFSTPQFTGLWAILGTTYIMQASVANQIAQNPTMQITHPVGTGPFELDSYSTSLIKFKPNPHYWGGTPPEFRGRGAVGRHQRGGQRCAGEPAARLGR